MTLLVLALGLWPKQHIPFHSLDGRRHADVPVHLMVQPLVGTTSKHFLRNQEKNSCLPLVYHESLLWSVFFCFEVFMIENDYTEKGKLVFLFRQNTYLQNKKHMLTCQRWDWLL